MPTDVLKVPLPTANRTETEGNCNVASHTLSFSIHFVLSLSTIELVNICLQTSVVLLKHMAPVSLLLKHPT